MKVTIKDLLNITGVQGYMLAGRNNIQIKLPAKFNIISVNRIKGELVYLNLVKEITE